MTEMEVSGGTGEDYQQALETMLTELQKLRAETQTLQMENQTLHLQETQCGNQESVLQQGAAPAPSVPAPHVKTPVGVSLCYSGKKEQLITFIAQSELYIQVRQLDFPNNSFKVAFVISLLEGEAAQWATPL
ncbi:protein LDOC1-like [Rhineura floridana]|uniref:protein LDOC1-like n=1 Tax=Rhineura floridana TaxID=261503 RepID=UPI002AC834F7|nr:protein LDOC1-like [Rhineura floridana]